jgi:hypothetical protein
MENSIPHQNLFVELLITYMPIVTLFLGAILGFLFSLWKDKINEDRKKDKEKKDLALKNLEEIFTCVSDMNVSAFRTYTDLLSNKENGEHDYSKKVSFKIRSFFPNLQKEYDEYIKIFMEFKTIQIKLYEKQNTSNRDERMKFEELSELFANKSQKLLTCIIDETKYYK